MTTDSHTFFIFFTTQPEFLAACVEKGCFGVSMETRRHKMWPMIRSISEGDRVFIRYRHVILCGPFFVVARPPEGVVADQIDGLWFKVDPDGTPLQFLPNWIRNFPLCFFFDPALTPDVNYCYINTLEANGFELPTWGRFSAEKGRELWEFIEANGSSFSDYVQRQHPLVRLPMPARTQRLLIPRIRTQRGVWVRSKSERLIDDWLHNKRIPAEYERSIVLDGRVITPDFYLPDCALYIEHLGLLEANPDYREDWMWKKAMYEKHGLKYITLVESDIADLDRNLASKLKNYLPRI